MNRYLIQYKLATVAELVKPFQYDGYDFIAYTPDEWWSCDAWVASKTIEAKTAGEAFYEFYKGINELIEYFSVVSQCAFRIFANTYFIFKQTNNPEKFIYIYYARSVEPVGLHFDESEINQLSNFEKITNKNALMYIMEAAKVNTFYPRTMMLLAAIEGFAGEVTYKRGNKEQSMTSKENLQKILGAKLYEKLYKRGAGLRHQLIHGNIKDRNSFDGLNGELYSKIVDYLRSEFNIDLDENVMDPQRNFHDNFEAAKMYKVFKNQPILDLKLIEEAIHDKNGYNPREAEMFTSHGENPTEY